VSTPSQGRVAGTTGRIDPASLAITDLSDDERSAFLAAVAE
jgi:hypothetical protein